LNDLKTSLKLVLYFAAGLIVLTVNKLRYRRGFRDHLNRRGYSEREVESAIAHDVKAVQEIERDLRRYTQCENPFEERVVLELGPGRDIGIGTLLLDRGAKKYFGFDKYDLMGSMNSQFYGNLKNTLATEDAKKQADLFASGDATRLHYTVDPLFNLESYSEQDCNLVISRAAFEHFDNVHETIKHLSQVVKSETVLCVLVDLMTHSRWIRQRDPNNIYRFPKWLYRRLHYPGIPNRVRPETYEQILNNCGWSNIQVNLGGRNVSERRPHTLVGLADEFNNYNMSAMTCVLLATKT